MKLNNSGWGIREMFVLSALLIFFFGVAIYFIYLLYSSLALDLDGVDNSQYEYIEQKIEMAAKNYVADLNQDIGETVIIYIDDLISAEYLNEITDPNTNNECDGYAVFNKDITTAYIKCDKYMTDGYEE